MAGVLSLPCNKDLSHIRNILQQVKTLNLQCHFRASNTFFMLTRDIMLKAAQTYLSALPTPPAKLKLRNTFTNQADKSFLATTTDCN